MLNITNFDALIVGCGISGSVIARHLSENMNKKILVIDRRNHIGGNMYDFVDENGILTQLYGPHTFHTNDKKLYEFMNKFIEFKEFYLKCMADIKGKQTPCPFNFKTIDDFYSKEESESIKNEIRKVYGDKETTTIVEMLKSENDVIREYAEFLYENDYKPYTAKQWGIDPEEIDISILQRVPVNLSYKDRYFEDKYQVMPRTSFTDFFKNILNHQNITVELNVDAFRHLKIESNEIFWDGSKLDIPMIFTGEIDALFKYKFGKLPYRSLKFEYKTLDVESYQEAPVVAYPFAEGFTRITEYTKLPVQKISEKTKIAIEYPLKYDANEDMEPYYPILTNDSKELYEKYKRLANSVEKLFLCGRLADFKYYNMDQALYNALKKCDNLDEYFRN